MSGTSEPVTAPERVFARAFIFETVNRIVGKSCFPQEALTDLDAAMRAVVIVEWECVGRDASTTPASPQTCSDKLDGASSCLP